MIRPPLSFPPLFTGVTAPEGARVADHALRLAVEGCDGGTVVHSDDGGDLSAAIVFAPEVALDEAAAMLPVCGIGLQNALGSLAPPELAIRLHWDGAIRVNGARCGALGLYADKVASSDVPDWLVVTLDVTFVPTSDEMGRHPGRTALHAEGCGTLSPRDLVEAWTRHSLVWISRWTNGELAAIGRTWTGIADAVGEPFASAGAEGTFLGIDDRFGALIRCGETLRSVPLTALLRHR